MAEPLPDKGNSTKRPRQGEWKRDPKDMDVSQLKHLPPGKLSHYYQLLRAMHPESQVSKKLFADVWQRDFMQKLRIRSTTHHAKCSLCIRHRMIIKGVPPGPARKEQLLEYRYRAESRLQASGPPSEVNLVSCIIDSFDQSQAKH